MNKNLAAKIMAAWLLALWVFPRPLRAAEIPALTLPSGVGVNIHFTRGHEEDLNLIAAAGFKFTRMDFFWGAIEKQKGIYDWSAYDELTANLKRHGLRAYYILDYSNPLYETNGASPQHPESIAAFTRWAAAAAEHFRGQHVIWEIWNEPNGDFWKPKADVQQYTALALATAKVVRAADPQATIFAPASSGLPWSFLKTFLQSGVLEFLDGVSVHPYRPPTVAPETAAKDYQKLRELIATNLPPASKKNIAIISGEWGYSSNVKGVSLQTQAEFTTRQQLFNLLHGVPISIWYDWKNDGNDPKENEHNFGTVRADLTLKPAYSAIKILTHELAGFAIQSRFPTTDANDFMLVLTNASHEIKLAVWTTGEAHAITLSLHRTSAKEIPVVSLDGQTTKVEISDGKIALILDGAPRYVTLGRARLRE